MNGKKSIKKKIKNLLSYSAEATAGRNWRTPKDADVVSMHVFYIETFHPTF